MRIIKLSISKSQKVNTGNFESVDYFAGLEAELSEGTVDELQKVHADLISQLDVLLAKQIKTGRVDISKPEPQEPRVAPPPLSPMKKDEKPSSFLPASSTKLCKKGHPTKTIQTSQGKSQVCDTCNVWVNDDGTENPRKPLHSR